jgi:uncharacterized membrane protein
MQKMFSGLVCFAQLLCLAALCHAASAAMLPQVGQNVADRVELFGKRIPLPPGTWRVAATGVGHVVGEDPGPYGVIGNVLLTRPAEDAAHEFVLIRTNAEPVRRGWGPPADCTEGTSLWQSVAEPRDLHNACAFIVAARSGRIASWAGDASVARLLPPWALIAGFRASDRNDVVEARYGVVPASRSQAAWFGDWQMLDPAQKRLLDRLGEWTRQMRQASIAALRGPAEQVPPIPKMPIAIQPAAAAAGEDITSLRLGLYKLATYRGPVTAWNFALATVLSGDIYIGATVAAWQSITHSALYFGNEMAWELPGDVPAMSFVASRGAVAGAASDASAERPGGFTLAGKQVPLPEGTWIALADEAAADAAGVVLGRFDGNTLLGLAVVHANPSKTNDIFGTASDCSRRDVYFSTIRYDTPIDGYCSYAKPVTPADAAPGDALWARARDRLAEIGVIVPPVLLTVGARVRTRENFVDVRYYFPPDEAMAGAELGVAQVASSPLPVEHVVALQAWADLVQQPLEQGVRGRLPAAMAELPWPWQAGAVQQALTAQAHAPLERLHAAGAIDDTEHARQLALADAALAERERQRWSLWTRSAYKVATYRALSYFDAVAVSWIITTSPEQSFAYATINAVAQPIMAYVNEIGWAGSGVGRAAAPLQPVDFPEIGRDRL